TRRWRGRALEENDAFAKPKVRFPRIHVEALVHRVAGAAGISVLVADHRAANVSVLVRPGPEFDRVRAGRIQSGSIGNDGVADGFTAAGKMRGLVRSDARGALDPEFNGAGVGSVQAA